MPESHSIIALFKWRWSVSIFKNISHALYGINEVVKLIKWLLFVLNVDIHKTTSLVHRPMIF